jgi:hypothetical protein
MFIAQAMAIDNNSVTITQLPDGVSIVGAQPLKQITATWNIYVTLDPPQYPEALIDQVLNLNGNIAAINKLESRGVDINVNAFKMRQQRMLALLTTHNGARRSKRGLLDIGGHLLHSLFGVATSGQIARLNEALTEVKDSQQGITHAHTALATVVNQTRAFAQQLALQQRQLAEQQMEFGTVIYDIYKALDDHARSIEKLELETHLDRYMDVLDLAVSQYVAQLSLYDRQRREMEAGKFTRDLLPQKALEDILSQASNTHQVIGSLEWYYSYLSVSPLWQETGTLIYQVELPLVAPRPFLLYNIMSHPVPAYNDTFAVKLNLEQHYAMDTISGNLFVPKRCIGANPIACISGPQYAADVHQCARGLLTNRQPLINKCQVKVTRYDGQSIIKMTSTNQYALATQGETLVIRCPGQPEDHVPLPRGCHNITCLKPCRLSGNHFHISCIDVKHLTRSYHMPRLLVTRHFGFSNSSSQNSTKRYHLPTMLDIEAHLPMDINVMALLQK